MVMPSLRVLMVVPKYPFPVAGGLERQSHALATALVARGHEVHALSSRFAPGQKELEMADGVRVHRVKWVDFKPLRFAVFPFSLARILWRLRRQVDIVHVHNISWFGAFTIAVAKLLKLPVITKLPGNGEFGIPAMRRRALGFVRVALLKRSDAVIAMTVESIAELQAIGYASSRVLKVTNGIILLPAVPRAGSTTVKVIFVGRLSWEKGVPDLLHAWAAVRNQAGRPALLRLIGDGPLLSEMRALAQELRVSEAVEFAGFSDDVPRELAAADIFVLPSSSEGNSNSVLEAMRASLPVVASRVGGTPMQVGPEGERFLFPAGDRQALAARLLELIDNEEMRVQAGAAMRMRIEKIFDIRLIADTYERAYGLIVGGGRAQVGDIASGPLAGGSVRLTCAE
jgi:glycosyltransferase involved in cell wall biosynthesis